MILTQSLRLATDEVRLTSTNFVLLAANLVVAAEAELCTRLGELGRDLELDEVVGAPRVGAWGNELVVVVSGGR